MPGPLAILGGVTVVGGIAMVALGLNEPLRNDVNYFLYGQRTNAKLDPQSYALLKRHGHIPQTDFVEDLKVQGLDGPRREYLYRTTQQFFTAYENLHAWRRGEFDQGLSAEDRACEGDFILGGSTPALEKLYFNLQQIGFTLDQADQLIRISEYIPTAQDIIMFAVREVYSPEIAQAFGQFEGVEKVLSEAEEDIRASGMRPETFAKYWAAHWALPSVQQGYQMLHRDVIDEPTLDKLMVALDIMPWWRDKLRAISYHPYTRVDVRRMHKYGVLGNDDLVRAYMDLGFDEAKAETMRDFTIAYNSEPIEVEQTEPQKRTIYERDLTKTDIINGYKDAILEADETRESLVAIGYSGEEADYYVSRVDYDKERDDTDAHLRYIHDAYVRNTIDFTQTTIKLDELNLSGKRKDRLFEIWDLEKLAKTQKPTKAETLKWFESDVIAEDECRVELAGLGYAPKYIDRYVEGVLDAKSKAQVA